MIKCDECVGEWGEWWCKESHDSRSTAGSEGSDIAGTTRKELKTKIMRNDLTEIWYHNIMAVQSYSTVVFKISLYD